MPRLRVNNFKSFRANFNLTYRQKGYLEPTQAETFSLQINLFIENSKCWWPELESVEFQSDPDGFCDSGPILSSRFSQLEMEHVVEVCSNDQTK